MTTVADLFALQELDTAADAEQQALEALRERLRESDELLAARAKVAEEGESLEQLRPRQRQLNWQVDDLQSHIVPRQKKLYDGSIRNPKELTSLQEEVGHLQAQKSRLEDELLAVMAQVEEQEALLGTTQRELAAVDAAWQREQAELRRQQEKYQQELADLQARRGRQVALLDGSLLSLYEALRQRRQGRAVARVEKGLCGGCRISLPTTLLQRSRSGFNVVQCPSCERILYMG